MTDALADRNAAAPTDGRGPRRLDVRVNELRQLFSSIDAAPFRERDLDPAAEQFIVEWAHEQPADAPLALCVKVAGIVDAGDAASLRTAVDDYFARAAVSARRRLKRLFVKGRWNLLIGVMFVAAANFISDFVGTWLGDRSYGRTIQDSIAIGAWVALWRPIEIFLYDWWPIHREARLYDRLAAMPVELHVATAALPDAGSAH